MFKKLRIFFIFGLFLSFVFSLNLLAQDDISTEIKLDKNGYFSLTPAFTLESHSYDLCLRPGFGSLLLPKTEKI